MYFSDPKRTLKFTIITKQGHKEVDLPWANVPRKKIEEYARTLQGC